MLMYAPEEATPDRLNSHNAHINYADALFARHTLDYSIRTVMNTKTNDL